MPTPAYTEFDNAGPDGTSGTGTTYTGTDLANIMAMRDSAIGGRVKGWIQSQTTGTGPGADRPQFKTWLNAGLLLGFRMNTTWGGTGTFQLSSVQWEWSNDNGASWAVMGAAQANTYDGSDNITATTNSGGFSTIVMELWTKLLRTLSTVTTHIAATGAAVHGLASMSTQAASAVAITGGTVNGTPVGDTTRARGSFTRVAEDKNALAPGAGAGALVDWAYGGTVITNNGVNAVTFANIPTGLAGHVVRVTNFNNTTWPGAVDFGVGGAPSIAGAADVGLLTTDAGGTVHATINWRAV